MLVPGHGPLRLSVSDGDGDDLFVEQATAHGARGSLLALERERILVLSGDVEPIRHDLRRHSHRVVSPRVGDQGEGSVDQLTVREPVAVTGAVVQERLHGHVLVPAGHDDIGLAGEDLRRAGPDRLEPAPTQTVHVVSRRGDREPRRQGSPARVEGVRTDLAHATHHDLIDLLGPDARPRGRLLDRGSAEDVGGRGPERLGEGPDRRPGASDHDHRIGLGFQHARPSNRRASCSSSATTIDHR